MENLNTIVEQEAQKFVSTQTQILSHNLKYVLLAVVIIMILLIVVLGGVSLGACKAINLGRVCEINSTYRNTFLFTVILALVCWVLYYNNVSKQRGILQTYEAKGFLPPEVERHVNELSRNSQIFLILANICSIPIYLLIVLVLFNVIRFLFNITGLPFLK